MHQQLALPARSPLSALFVMILITAVSLTFAWGAMQNSEVVAVGGSIVDNTPTGASIEGYWTTAPDGYLLEDGSAVSRTTYANLFSVIGTTFGAGDGSTTFNLPDSRGKVTVTQNTSDSQFDALGEEGGEKTHTLSEAEMGAHDHDFSGQTIAWGAGLGTVYFGQHQEIPDSLVWAVAGTAPSTPSNILYTCTSGGTGCSTTWSDTYNEGSSQSHNEIQPYIVALRVIRY